MRKQKRKNPKTKIITDFNNHVNKLTSIIHSTAPEIIKRKIVKNLEKLNLELFLDLDLEEIPTVFMP